MQAFEFYSPTKILFGPETERQVGQQVIDFGGSRVLVLYGGKSAVKSGLIDRVCQSLSQSGLVYEAIGGVQPNPRLSFARDCLKKAQELKADFILGVGGGSVIDTAKAVANAMANSGLDLWDDLWMRRAPLVKALPVGAVLTISAAGSESSDSAVLTNDETQEKRGINADCQRPRFAIMNPELTYTLPKFQLTCGIVDIMMHTMDRYFNPVTTNQLTDEIAEGVLRTVIQNGRRAVEDSHNYQAMSELMWAGSVSHNGLTGLGNIRDFAPHQLGHELGAQFDAAHGATLSAVWGSWAQYCVQEDPARFAQFGQKVWGLDPAGKSDLELAMAAIDTTVQYFSSLGMPTCLSELTGSTHSQEILEHISHRCTFYGKRTIGSFKVLGYDDILSIYQLANH